MSQLLDTGFESRVPVITGIGVAAPNGLGTDEFWSATRAGTSGIRPITRFPVDRYPVRVAGEIADFVPHEHIPSRLIPSTDRSTQLALTCSGWALTDTGLDLTLLPEFTGSVITTTTFGGVEFIQHELERLWARGPQHVTAYMSYAWFYGVNTGQLSIRHKLKGASGVVVTGQAGGLDAIGQARRRLRDGQRFVVTGGADAPICQYGIAAEATANTFSTGSDPATAYLPFDQAAAGHVPGEGAAMMVLEPLAAARERDVGYGVVAGYGATFDPHVATGRPPNLAKAAKLALADAGLKACDIDVVFADGAGTMAADRAEATAIRDLFGMYGVPVTVPKSMTGRMYGAGAAADVAAALLSLHNGEIPPVVGSTAMADHGIDLVTTPRQAPLRHALVLARGDGGFNSAVVLSAMT